MTFIPQGLATSIGSLPYRDPKKAVEKVLQAFPEIPAWPQLPNRSFLENMYVQFSEGLPCIVVDSEKEKIYFDTNRDLMAEMEEFYSKIIERNLDQFAVSEEYAAGFHRFLEVVAKGRGKLTRLSYVKGQVIGPISFGLTVTDQNKRAILYNDDFMDTVVKSCAMKAAWQVRELKKVFPNVMIWLDEPYLASFGSAYISLSDEQVLAFIGEVVDGIQAEGGIAGIHCCGNTDWSILMKTDLKIINFDAYGYFTGMTLYPEALKAFLKGGKILAVGLIPTSEKILEETVDSIAAKLKERLAILSDKIGMSPKEIWKQCLLTPSCGTGTLSEELTGRVLELSGKIHLNF